MWLANLTALLEVHRPEAGWQPTRGMHVWEECRYHVGMQQEQALQRIRGKASIVLDTTYCSPQYLFPPQLQVFSWCLASLLLLWPLAVAGKSATQRSGAGQLSCGMLMLAVAPQQSQAPSGHMCSWQ